MFMTFSIYFQAIRIRYLNAISSNAPLQDRDNNDVRDWRDRYSETTRLISAQEVFIPNGFSPNGDNINDYFKTTVAQYNEDRSFAGELPFGDNFPNAKIEIYNRWNQLVYRQENYGNLSRWDESQAWWDGTSNVGINNWKRKTATWYILLYPVL